MSPVAILISGARAPVALELARSFHAHGHRVVMIDSIRLTIARWSNSVSKFYVVPSPRFKPTEFMQRVQALIVQEKIDHFIPTCEEAIYVSLHRHNFDCRVWTADASLMLRLHHKFEFTRMGLPVPETSLLKDFRDWENSSSYVFKPIFSRFAQSVIIGQSCTPEQFTQPDQWIAQRRIIGQEVCVYSIWDDGQLKAIQLYHPLYRAGKGAGIFFEPIENQAILTWVKRFGEQHQYTGQLSFDVIVEKETGYPYFIECNPRSTSGAHLLNHQLAPCFLGESAHMEVASIEFALKYALCLLHPSAFLSTRIRKATDVVFRKKDPLPFFLQFLSVLEPAWISIRRRTGFLAATTVDIEWNGPVQEGPNP